MRRVDVDGAALEVEIEGSGEPVLLIQTALVADEVYFCDPRSPDSVAATRTPTVCSTNTCTEVARKHSMGSIRWPAPGCWYPATLAERLGIEQATDQVDAPMAIKQQSLGGSVDFSSWAAAKIPVTRGRGTSRWLPLGLEMFWRRFQRPGPMGCLPLGG